MVKILTTMMMYFPTDCQAQEPQNPQNHRVVEYFEIFRIFGGWG